ncbi:MAG: preprotein translocase subunit SecG [Candidatus Hydrogenedentota bacterium]|jgi:preprotein translocase subunit SecG|uniref:Protein-export membrane protein SecG n=1 Tax=Sumerlaea chitinivorans TaxID=2250252 RepID=A0A2Z4Y3T2_SUMC1|nr:Preprotein translocase subunit SecG [Candidatus Sumerlaea chitinivorans]MCX7963734.1 preprotein translocase subunit SecG [Candidatus Sumerlaea chitinivorans]RMH26576.1 MAG: preprotein translocase subunit SecG [Candidatus Hydrogenedentota bacterium]GIX44257.1 MAG: hypothetical protein KatS3mg130_0665 [Candidatus Sumerlaea sp.]
MGLGVIGFYLVIIIYFFVCLFLIMVILAQEGKGGGLSGLGGASAIGETFGFGGAATALRKWTRNIAILFIVLTIILTYWGERIARSRIQQFRSGGAEAMVPVETQPIPQQPVQPESGQPQAVPGSANSAGEAPAGQPSTPAPTQPTQ